MAAIVLILVGAVVIFFGAIALWDVFGLFVSGRRVAGTLAGWRHVFHHQYLGNGLFITTRQYHPVVRFETATGAERRVTSKLAYNQRSDWPADRPFIVRYSPADPREATVDPIQSTWVFAAVFTIVGIVILATGLCRLL